MKGTRVPVWEQSFMVKKKKEDDRKRREQRRNAKERHIREMHKEMSRKASKPIDVGVR